MYGNNHMRLVLPNFVDSYFIDSIPCCKRHKLNLMLSVFSQIYYIIILLFSKCLGIVKLRGGESSVTLT